jgi:hypothetical protein
METIIPSELIQSLIKTAKLIPAASEEDFNAYDSSGGNFDDAYQIGVDDGEIYLARHILDAVGVVYDERK